jgi:hypothetical protein
VEYLVLGLLYVLSPETKMSDIIPQETLDKLNDPRTGAAPPQKEFIAVGPAGIEMTWPSIRDDLATIDNPDGTPLEEIYYMLKSNQATLFLLRMNGEQVGFVIVRLILPDLHLWLVKAKNGYDCMEVFRPEIMHIARNGGAKFVTFGSRRRAWQDVAKDHGFAVRTITYFCPVEQVQGAG